MKLLKLMLNLYSDSFVIVNPEAISYMLDNDYSGTDIYMTGRKKPITVEESVLDIVSALDYMDKEEK